MFFFITSSLDGYYQTFFVIGQYKAILSYPNLSNGHFRFVMTYFFILKSILNSLFYPFCRSVPSGVWFPVYFLDVFSLGSDCLRLFFWFSFFAIWTAMARPKRVPRRLSRGADRASQGEGASGQGEEAASSRPLSQARNRRYEAHSCVLRELRRIERHMQPAIPRLPFQRLVREICEQWSPNIRWTASGLLCLQEVAEDWLVAFFEDSYLLAAHAHRLTIFPRDFEVLRRIRYRYDQLLVPGAGIDRRAQEILTVPPLHPRARVAEPSQAVHDRATRSLIQRRQAAQVSAESTPPAGHASAEPTPPVTAAATP